MTAGMRRRRRAGGRAGQAGFGLVLRAEWTKFRTVRGWVSACWSRCGDRVVGLLASLGRSHCCDAPRQASPCSGLRFRGAGRRAGDRRLLFVRQPLTGDGSITARVTSMTRLITFPGSPNAIVPGVVPWAKAGVIITPSTSRVAVRGGDGLRRPRGADAVQLHQRPAASRQRVGGLPALAAADPLR